jgi:ubiquinone/menaquinone biosynthesis C-methylase UbiE
MYYRIIADLIEVVVILYLLNQVNNNRKLIKELTRILKKYVEKELPK